MFIFKRKYASYSTAHQCLYMHPFCIVFCVILFNVYFVGLQVATLVSVYYFYVIFDTLCYASFLVISKEFYF